MVKKSNQSNLKQELLNSLAPLLEEPAANANSTLTPAQKALLNSALTPAQKASSNSSFTPAQKAKLVEIYDALEKTDRPIYDDERLAEVLYDILIKKLPEIMRHPQSAHLRKFCNSLTYEPAPDKNYKPGIKF